VRPFTGFSDQTLDVVVRAARQNPDREPDYILAAYMASRT